MKKLFIATAVITVLFASCTSKEQYKITGKVSGLNNETIYLSKIENNKPVKVDSVNVNNGTFSFEGKVENSDLYIIQFGGRNNVPLFIENIPITVDVDVKNINKAKVVGGKNQETIKAFSEAQKKFIEREKVLGQQYQKAVQSKDMATVEQLKKDYGKMQEEKAIANKKFLQQHNNSVASAFLAAQLAVRMDMKELEEIYNILSGEAKNNKYAKQISDKIVRLKKIIVGKPSPTFNYENYKGGKTSLESLRGKVVYIDVWATWCGPCKAEIPALKEVEKDYHGKEIVFVSISTDEPKNKNVWKKMIEEKEMGGVQLFADDAFRSNFVKSYEITGIPRFILLDKKGNIVNANAPRPSNPELRKLLDETLAK